jgi:SPP1 gp7 family putative phage head morphogenesis protein
VNRAAKINRAIAHERARLDRMERAASVRLANSYNSALEVLLPMLDDVTARINDRRAAGLPVTPGWLYQQARYRQMIDQAKEQSRKLALATGQNAIDVSSSAALAGTDQAIQLLGLSGHDPNTPGIVGVFTGINEEALQAITAELGPGSPLVSILSEFPGDAEKDLRKMLVTGMAIGLGSDEMRRHLRTVMGRNLVRANTIIRTEIHRAHRESTRAAFKANSGHLNGWIWMADLSARTCAACWAMHGTKHSLDESMGTHPNCRCTMMPWTKSFAELGINVDPSLETRVEVPTGSDVFSNLSLRDKIAILGPEGYDAYRQGAQLTDFVRVTKSDDWGITRSVRSAAAIRAQHGLTKIMPSQNVPPGSGQTGPGPTPVVPASPGSAGTPIPAQPAATPITVSQNLSYGGTSKVQPAFMDETIAAIDSVHHDGSMPTFKTIDGGASGGANGHFDPGNREIVVDPGRNTPKVTLAHEIGHAIDFTFGNQTSMASGADPDFKAWRKTIRQSQKHSDLTAFSRLLTPASKRKFTTYVQSWEEYWARSYSQYIAVKTQDPQMLQEIEFRRSSAGLPYHDQWDDADFVAIAQAIDGVLKIRGWIP